MGAIYGSSYYTIANGTSWPAARSSALALGGDLVAINSPEENIWVFKNFGFDNNGYAIVGYWIGFTDAEREGDWKWSNNSSIWSPYGWGCGRLCEPNGNGDHAWVKVGFDHRRRGDYTQTYESIVSASNAHWSKHGEPLWDKRGGPGWDDTWINGEGTNYGVAEIPLSYFSITDASLREGKGGDITISRTGGTTTSQTLRVQSSDGTATIADDDYAAINKTVTFAAGETEKTISVATTEDLDIESDESFKVKITAEGSDEVTPQISDDIAQITIQNDDFYASLPANSEKDFTGQQGYNGWRYGQYRAIFSPKSFEEFKHYHKPGGDYIWSAEKPTGYNNFNQLWASGGHPNSQRGKYSWAVRRWTSNQNTKVTITGTINDTNRRGGGDGITGRIFHNDKEIYTQLVNHESKANGYEYQIDAEVREGDTIDFAIDYNSHDGDDSTRFTALIEKATSPTYSLSNSTSSIDEKSQSSVLTTISTTGVDQGTRLYYEASGSSVDSSDFTTGDIKGTRLIQPDGTATIRYTAAADKTTEGPESFTVKLYTDRDRKNLVASSSSISISDSSKSPPPLSYFSITDTTFREGKGGDVTISRTGGTVTSQTLRVQSSDGTATTADSDYAAVDKTITFAAGETSKTINISTTADLKLEEDETFKLTMTAEDSDPITPQIADGTATVTIQADDFKRGDSLYTIVYGPSWKQAEDQAVKLGGNLVSINNSKENDWVYENFQAPDYGYWIGFTDEKIEGKWEWSSGDKADWMPSHFRPPFWGNTSTSWAPNGGKVENYVHVIGPSTGLVNWKLNGKYPEKHWNDLRGSGDGYISSTHIPHYGVAEIPLNTSPTYSISHSKTTIKENKDNGHHGESTQTLVRTTNVDPGTYLYFSIEGSGINKADFSTPLEANIRINTKGEGEHLNTVIKDELTEGNESFTVKLYTDYQRTQLVATSDPITILDTSKTPLPPTYSLSISPRSIDEGDAFRASIATTQLDPGTRLYYAIKGDLNSSDINGGHLTGSITLNNSGSASFTRRTTKDLLTEGAEDAQILLYTDQKRTLQVAKDSLNIRDTSTTPLPTYSISSSPSRINEGDSLNTTISTSNLSPGTRLHWAISGSNVNNADFSSGSLTGSCTTNKSGSCSFSHSLATDITTEGNESFLFNLFSDSSGNTPLASSSSITIRDTSTTPKPPTYSLSLAPTSIDEGDSFRASITTTRLDAGTRLYYAIKGDIDSSDLIGGQLTGSITLNSSGAASFTRRTTQDLFSENTESAQVLLYTDSQHTIQVAKDSLNIRDTSKTPKKATYSIRLNASSLQEGDRLASSITTENVDPGTTLHWALSGAGINAADFSSGSLSGQNNLDKSGSFSLSHALAQDLTTEGTEQLTLQLFSDPGRNNLLEQQKLSIVDTSTTPQSASLLSASVDGNTLSLIFDGELDSTTPSFKRFSITADGKTHPIRSASINANSGTLDLTLASPVKPSQSVELTYTDLKGNQTTGALQTPDGTDLPSFSTSVANISRDNTPPSIIGAYANATSLILSFSEALDITTPDNSSWTLKEDGKAIPIAASSIDALAAQLNLTLASPLDRGSLLSLSYRDLNGNQNNNVIQDLAGNDLPSFSKLDPENRTRRSADPLDINTAEIDADEIVLAFNREIDFTTPSKGTFRLTAEGKSIKVTRIFLYPNDREAVLKIAKPVEHGADVSLSYTDAKGNQNKNVIQDIDGNDLVSFSSLKLTNNTRKQSKAFIVDDANANGSTINLYLTDRLSKSIPNPSRFRVTANNKRQLISSIATEPKEGIVTLTLKTPIKPKQDILIDYRDLNGDQSSGVLEDNDGNDLASFSKLSVLNDTTDSDPPVLEDAYLDGKELILEFDELLQPGKLSKSRFKIRAGKKRVRVISAEVPEDDAIAIINLKSAIPSSTQNLSLTYRDFKGDQSSLIIQDTDGNDLPSLRNFAVEII